MGLAFLDRVMWTALILRLAVPQSRARW